MSPDKSMDEFLTWKCDCEILFDNYHDDEVVEFSVSVRFDKELKDEFLRCWDRSLNNNLYLNTNK
jgi:hypothetical protein